MKYIIAFLLFILILAQEPVSFVTELTVQKCKQGGNFQDAPYARHAVIHQGVVIIPAIEKRDNSHDGYSSSVLIYYKGAKNYRFYKKIDMPIDGSKFVSGTVYISYSKDNLLVGFIGNIPGGDKNKQKLIMYDRKQNWLISKIFPIHWNDEPKPKEGTRRTDVRMVAVAGDYLIHGMWYWHSYGFYVDTPIGASKHNHWDYNFGGMNTDWRKPIATAYSESTGPKFLQTISTHSYVLYNFKEIESKVNWTNSLYGTNNARGLWGVASAIDETGEIIAQSEKSQGRGFISIWNQPRNGRRYSYEPDAIISEENESFGSSVALYKDFVITVSGQGSILIYKMKSKSEYRLVQTIKLEGVFMDKVTQNVDEDGAFVVGGKRNDQVVNFVYTFEKSTKIIFQ